MPNHPLLAEAGAELEALTAPPPRLQPGLHVAVGQVFGFEEHLSPPTPQHAGAQSGLGMEMGMGWDGMAGKNLSCPVGSLWNPACGRDHPSVSILFCSIGKHIVLNTHSLSFPFSASALCACALRLVSGCLDPPGLLVRVRC